jgi:hypothetical protein
MSSWSVWTLPYGYAILQPCRDCVAGRQRATPKIQGAQGPSYCGQQQQHGMAAWTSSQHDTWALGAGQQHWRGKILVRADAFFSPDFYTIYSHYHTHEHP